jgi:potassium-dependent mechanosensitive channel
MLATQHCVKLILVVGALAFGFELDAPAQSFLIGPALSPAPADAPTVATPRAADKRAENAEQLRLAMRNLEEKGSADTAAAQEVAYRRTLDAVLTQQQVVEKQIRELETRKTELETQLKTGAAGEKVVACSFLELDDLKDELAAEQVRASLFSDKLAAAKLALEKAHRSLEESKKKTRQAQEAVETAKDAPNASELATAAEEAQQASRLSEETLSLRKREMAREQLAQEAQRLTVQICQERLSRISPLVVFCEDDFQRQIDDIAKKEESANRMLDSREASLRAVTVQIQEAQQQLDAETGDRTVLSEKLAAQRRAHEKISDEIDSLTQRLQWLAQLRVAWNRRFQIASAGELDAEKQAWDELKDWQIETKAALSDLAASLRVQILRMRDLRTALTSITNKADAAKTGPEGLLPWLDMQKSQVEAMLKTRERDMVTIETSRRVHEKLLDEIGSGVQALTPKGIALGAWYQAKLIWNYDLAPNNNIPITVGKIVTGITIFVSGWVISRFLSAMFAYRLLKRFRLSKDGSAAIRTLVFYSLLIVAALVALNWVNVPLTAFTILGGALAIGVGFGSQALINNFIGGLIMLAERPVRLGERITFGNYDGVVEEVGFRCTKLRTMTDHLVTIPNSTLINESIENVARRRTIRRLMNVTITYDTPRDKVAEAVQAIRDILEEKDLRERIHPIVGFEELPPRVFFNDYNAESLNILVLYWYAPTDWWAYVEHSERINYRIMEEFERLGVEFAFPSRTLYVKHQEGARALAPSSNENHLSGNGSNGHKAHAGDPYG